MANPRIRPFPLYLKGKKFAEAHGNAFNGESGDELQFGAEGIIGLSEGIPTAKIDADYVVPVAGTQIDVLTLWLNKTDIGVGIFMGGKYVQFTGRITNVANQSESQKGTATGKCTITCASNIDLVSGP